MEEVEMFLAPLTARSKVREVLRGLVATRQVHTISLGHAPHFYVAGTLPEFAAAPTAYASSSMPASAYFLHSRDHDEEMHDHALHAPVAATQAPFQVLAQAPAQAPAVPIKAPESHTPRIPAAHKPAPAGKSSTVRPHFSRPAAHSRDRKPAQSSSSSRTARRSGPETRSSSARPGAARNGNGSRPSSGTRWTPNGAKNTTGKSNGTHSASGGSNGVRSNSVRGNGTHSNGAPTNGNGNARSHSAKVTPGVRKSKPSTSAMSQRNGNGHGSKTAAKSSGTARGGSLLRNGSAKRKDARPDARSARSSRKPALSAGAKAGNSKRYGFTAPSRQSAKPNSKKRG
jgi:hypothetical protein